eukprot:182343-Chlamydomonas_euryale.AAC.1
MAGTPSRRRPPHPLRGTAVPAPARRPTAGRRCRPRCAAARAGSWTPAGVGHSGPEDLER